MYSYSYPILLLNPSSTISQYYLLFLFILVTNILLYCIGLYYSCIHKSPQRKNPKIFSFIPAGFYIPDIVIAATVGNATGWSVAPLISICGNWLARSSILQFLLHFVVIAWALSSQFFPYSTDAPKRVILQHSFLTAGISKTAVANMFEFATVFKHYFNSR